MNSQALSKQTLRTHFRAQRRALSNAQRKEAARKIAQRIQALPEYQPAQAIGVYYATPEEISLDPFITQARRDQKQLYLPVIDDQATDNRMSFQAWLADETLTSNQHGIPEPSSSAINAPSLALDIVLLPLVAFDRKGRRLGMGGGFYDRFFSKTHQNDTNDSDSILRIGIAHSSQCSSVLPSDQWDVNCHAIATEKELIRLY